MFRLRNLWKIHFQADLNETESRNIVSRDSNSKEILTLLGVSMLLLDYFRSFQMKLLKLSH